MSFIMEISHIKIVFQANEDEEVIKDANNHSKMW